ncbi:MAG: aminoacyl-tRNA hydrolase [bacterium]|nr:aminoacyl-tRNA hydrolase [bacterium]
MKLIIGIGNPGEKYRNNRHNTGFLVIDKLKAGISNFQFSIFKSNTLMNDSGSFVKKLLSRYPGIPVSSLYVIHDDLDLPLGTWKLQFAKGPKDHGGINDIEQKLGTKDFWRIRVGIDPTTSRRRGTSQGNDFVLADFLPEEKIILNKVILEICKKLATL